MKKFLKLLTTIMISAICSSVYATGTGPYFGIQVGATNTHNITANVQTGTIPPTVATTPKNTGVGGRIYVGYNFVEYLAIEGGFTHYGPSTFYPSISTSCGNPQIHENGVDIVGKGILPLFGSGFDIFGKLGGAIIRTTLSGSLTSGDTTCGSHATTNYVRPTAAIGASYDFTPYWVGEFTISRVFHGGSFQNADMISLGISYHWVDVYCGQFLC